MLLPEFVCVTNNLPSTLNSYYTESGDYFFLRLSGILRKIGLSFKFKTDHVFVDTGTKDDFKIRTNILKDRVSDHCPIEISLYK